MTDLQHVDDYPEIPISLGSTRDSLKTGGWRSVRPILSERTAPCSTGCPAGVPMAPYLHLIAAGRLEAAWALFTRHNPFPRLTGRVCPHTCEEACSLAAVTDDGSVSIRSVERWLGDASAHLPHPLPYPETGRRVAVIGSGPAGLSAAYYLARTGHKVTVLERQDKPGGMLRHAVPEYRLPGEIVDDEVGRLAAMGIRFRVGIGLGEEIDLDEVAAEFDAVFVATGASRERGVGIRGEELFTAGLGFLESVRRGRAQVPTGRCAVIGGGNTALDVARVARRLGADTTVLYRRTEAEMPAVREEYEHARRDGVRFSWLTAPREAVASLDGIVLTVEEMELGEPDSSGRRRPEPTGRTRDLVFDTVFSAVGETADLAPFPERLRRDDGWLDVGAGGVTRDPSIHVGGDLVTGPSTVIAAIVAGREAARSIDKTLGFADRWPSDGVGAEVTSFEVNPAYRVRRAAAHDPPARSLEPLAEETGTISDAEVLAEIERCLSCGHCNECGTCFVFCPDAAIGWEDGPVVDLEFCKGCGICVTECPGRAMVLVDEREVARV